MGSRTWIKIYCDKWLNGTIRYESSEFRGIWVDLLVLAGSGKYGDSGEIKITDQVGFLDEQLAGLLQISRQKWATMKKKLIETDRVIIKNGNIIAIKNWSKYQSEYNRQKPYRHDGDTNNNILESSNLKLQTKVTTESATQERDKRLEKENIELESSLSINNILELYKKMEGFREDDSLDETIEDEIKKTVNIFSAGWVSEAIQEAMKKRKHWEYAIGILNNWKRFGKNAKTSRKFYGKGGRGFVPKGTYSEILAEHQRRASEKFGKVDKEA